MSAHHVLGVLEDDEERLWATLDQAIALADVEHARLTLAKTTDPGWILRWFGPAALNAMCVSSDALDFRTSASHKLARAAEFVPACVPVTTQLLGESTPSALLELVRRGPYDVVVVTDALFGRRRRLRCELEREDVRLVVVPGRPAPLADVRAADAAGQRAKARA
ncbi:MAG TPA: hypothetical protein VG325_17970 [Solirubrobacteraceae bacterium]|nr:hypothetical protein [Solirubrobacteraceae bacterium]